MEYTLYIHQMLLSQIEKCLYLNKKQFLQTRECFHFGICNFSRCLAIEDQGSLYRCLCVYVGIGIGIGIGIGCIAID